MEEKLGYYALYGLKWLVNKLPERINYYLGLALGSLLFYVVKDRRELSKDNIQAGLGYSEQEAHQLTKEVFQDLAIKTIEVLTLESWSLADFHDKIEVEGWENFKEAYKQDQGIILFTGHFGNWEILGHYFCALDYPTNALAKKRNNKLLAEEIWRIRESRGGTVFDYKQEVKRAFKRLLKQELLLILGDQDAGSKGKFIEFFDQLASAPQGPVSLAQKSNSIILPTYLVREGIGEYRLFIEPGLEVPKDASEEVQKEYLQKLASSLEAKITDYPAQWLWVHDRWGAEPPEAIKE